MCPLDCSVKYISYCGLQYKSWKVGLGFKVKMTIKKKTKLWKLPNNNTGNIWKNWG